MIAILIPSGKDDQAWIRAAKSGSHDMVARALYFALSLAEIGGFEGVSGGRSNPTGPNPESFQDEQYHKIWKESR